MQAEGAGQEEKQEQIIILNTERNDKRMKTKINSILIENISYRIRRMNI